MSRFVLIAAIVLIVFLGLMGISSMKESYKLLPVQESVKADSIPTFANWHDFTAPNNKFTVKLPTLPQNATQTIKDPQTHQYRNYDMYVAQNIDGSVFMISLITFQNPLNAVDSDTLMRTTINDLSQSNPENKLADFKQDTYENHPAFKFKIESNDKYTQGLTFIKDKTLYVLLVISKDKEQENKDYNYFIQSFQMQNPVDTSVKK